MPKLEYHPTRLKKPSTLSRYVSNYKESMRNVAGEGVDILCYNFMPVVDWTRTDLEFEWGDGSKVVGKLKTFSVPLDLNSCFI